MKRCFGTVGLLAVACVMAVMNLRLLAEDAVPQQSSKSPVPDAAALKDATQQVNDVYKDDVTKARKPEDKIAVAKKMLVAASETKNDTAGRYALLTMARDLAASAGDADAAFEAVDELAKCYQTNPFTLKLDALTKLAKAVRLPEIRRDIAARAFTASDEAIAADDYDAAKALVDIGASSARLSKNLDLVKEANVRVREVAEARMRSGQVKKALVVLVDNPKDPEANLVVGRYYCFTKGDWDKGLPMLAISQDTTLKALSEMELSKPDEAKKQASLGDGWWTLAEKEVGATKRRIQVHAAGWYTHALPNTTGLAKARIEKRLAEMPNTPELLTEVGGEHASLIKKIFLFNDEGTVKKAWELSGDWKLAQDGLRIGPGTLATRDRFKGDFTLVIEGVTNHFGLKVAIWNEVYQAEFGERVVIARKGIEVAVKNDRGKPTIFRIKESNADTATTVRIIKSTPYQSYIKRIAIEGFAISGKVAAVSDK